MDRSINGGSVNQWHKHWRVEITVPGRNEWASFRGSGITRKIGQDKRGQLFQDKMSKVEKVWCSSGWAVLWPTKVSQSPFQHHCERTHHSRTHQCSSYCSFQSSPLNWTIPSLPSLLLDKKEGPPRTSKTNHTKSQIVEYVGWRWSGPISSDVTVTWSKWHFLICCCGQPILLQPFVTSLIALHNISKIRITIGRRRPPIVATGTTSRKSVPRPNQLIKLEVQRWVLPGISAEEISSGIHWLLLAIRYCRCALWHLWWSATGGARGNF